MNRLLDQLPTKSQRKVAAPSTNGANGTAEHMPSPSEPSKPSTPSTPAPSATPASGREANGRFSRGNPGGPGNPFARQSAALRKRIQAKLTDEKLDKIVDTLIEEAEKNKVAAAKLLLSYGIGQPTPAADPDSLDLQEWKVLRQQVKVSDVNEFLNTFPIDEMCEMLNVLKPIRSEQWKKPLRRGFIEQGWEKPDRWARPEHVAVPPGGAPIANRPNGAEAPTPRDRAAKRNKLKKKYAIKGGKLVKRTD